RTMSACSRGLSGRSRDAENVERLFARCRAVQRAPELAWRDTVVPLERFIERRFRFVARGFRDGGVRHLAFAQHLRGALHTDARDVAERRFADDAREPR